LEFVFGRGAPVGAFRPGRPGRARAERRPGGGATIRAAQCGAQLDEGADVLELIGGSCEYVYRLLEQHDGLFAVGGGGEHAQARAARAWKFDAFGEREMLFDELAGGVELAAGEEGLAGVDAPGGEAWVADAKLVPTLGRGE